MIVKCSPTWSHICLVDVRGIMGITCPEPFIWSGGWVHRGPARDPKCLVGKGRRMGFCSPVQASWPRQSQISGNWVKGIKRILTTTLQVQHRCHRGGGSSLTWVLTTLVEHASLLPPLLPEHRLDVITSSPWSESWRWTPGPPLRCPEILHPPDPTCRPGCCSGSRRRYLPGRGTNRWVCKTRSRVE